MFHLQVSTKAGFSFFVCILGYPQTAHAVDFIISTVTTKEDKAIDAHTDECTCEGTKRSTLCIEILYLSTSIKYMYFRRVFSYFGQLMSLHSKK